MGKYDLRSKRLKASNRAEQQSAKNTFPKYEILKARRFQNNKKAQQPIFI